MVQIWIDGWKDHFDELPYFRAVAEFMLSHPVPNPNPVHYSYAAL